jgi:hypothetical protein
MLAIRTNAPKVSRDFRQLDKLTKAELGAELKEAAAPVVTTARELVSQFTGAKVSTITARRVGPRVRVQQGARKTTGQHPQFGALQMTHVLIPARDEHEEEIRTAVAVALHKYALAEGF